MGELDDAAPPPGYTADQIRAGAAGHDAYRRMRAGVELTARSARQGDPRDGVDTAAWRQALGI